MAPFTRWFIFYILSILYPTSCTASIISIGFHVAPTSNSESTENTTITLYWSNDKIECIFTPSSYGEWYGCNTTTFLSYITNCSLSQYKMHITIPLNDGLWINEIRIYDDNNNTYYYNQFCSSLTFPFWSYNKTTNCSNYPYPIWPIFCIGTYCNDYNALNLDLSYFETTQTLVTLSSSISDDICSMNTSFILSTEDTDNPPLPGVTLPFYPSSPTMYPTLNPLDISSTMNVIDTTLNMRDSPSFNIMNIILPALLITVCICFVGVILFFICNRKKNDKYGNKKHIKSSSHKHTQIQMQSSTSTHNGSPVIINNNARQILIHHNSNRRNNNNNNKKNNNNNNNIRTDEHSSSESIVNGAKTNTENEGIIKGIFLDSDNMNQNGFKIGHKVTFDSADIGVNSLPASPLEPTQSAPLVPPIINIQTIQEIHEEIRSNEDSDSSLYRKQHQFIREDEENEEDQEDEEEDNNNLGLRINLKNVQTTKGWNTPNTPEPPGDDDDDNDDNDHHNNDD